MTNQSKQIFDLLQREGGFKNPLIDPVNSLTPIMSEAIGYMDFLNSITEETSPTTRLQLNQAGLTIQYCTAYKSKVNTMTPVNTTLINHGATSVKEFSRRIQIAKSYILVMNSATKPFTGNPYQNVMMVSEVTGINLVSNVKNSLLSSNVKLEALKMAIQGNSSNISSEASAAKISTDSSNQSVTSYVNGVPLAIKSEANDIELYIETTVDGYLAVSLPIWSDDVNITGVVDKVATAALKALL